MAKEIYLYSPIYDFVAQGLIAQLEDYMGQPVTLRSNTPGGGVFANYGICAKMQEHGDVTIKVDGNASSSGANMLLYAKSSECLDVSKFTLHRADGYVSNEEEQAYLDRINNDLKAKMLKRFDADTFKTVTGVSIEDMFDPKQRINVQLDAKQAKQIGLVQKINKLTPQEITAFNNRMEIAAEVTQTTQTQKNNTMTLDELKAQHPAIYAQVIAAGKTEGTTEERARVKAFMQWHKYDSAGVEAKIADGSPFGMAEVSEFSLKALNAKGLETISKENAKEVITEEAKVKEPTAEEKSNKEFLAEVAALNKKDEVK